MKEKLLKILAIQQNISKPLKIRLRCIAVISILNQFLEFASILLLFPLVILLLNPQFEIKDPYFHIFNITPEYQLPLLLAVLVFWTGKNIMSVKIIEEQSKYYYRIADELSEKLLRQFLSKDLVAAKQTKNSDLIKKIIYVPNDFAVYVLASTIQLWADALLLALILIGSLFINLKATGFLLLFISVILVLFYFYDRNKLRTINKTISEKYNQNLNHILNTVSGYTEIKINQLEASFLKNFKLSNGALNQIYAELNSNRLSKSKYTETFLILMIGCLSLFSKYFASNPQTTFLFLSFLFAASVKIIPSVNRILINLANFRAHSYTLDILTDDGLIADEKSDPTATVTLDKGITLGNIQFGFEKANSLFESLHLNIAKGSIIGIYGDSGEGKSTLVNIIAALIAPDAGDLLCDGIKINQQNKWSYLGHIAYVSQSPVIFEGTILENLLVMQPQQNPDSVKELMLAFDIQSVIDELPQKMDTFLGSNSSILSGGQLQRLSIVRALLKKPKLLILDEATNQLDNALKEKTLRELKVIARKENLTIVSISHDIKELEAFCDHCYELKNGSLI